MPITGTPTTRSELQCYNPHPSGNQEQACLQHRKTSCRFSSQAEE
jgi:hypothetical protein